MFVNQLIEEEEKEETSGSLCGTVVVYTDQQ